MGIVKFYSKNVSLVQIIIPLIFRKYRVLLFTIIQVCHYYDYLQSTGDLTSYFLPLLSCPSFNFLLFSFSSSITVCLGSVVILSLLKKVPLLCWDISGYYSSTTLGRVI